VSNAAAPRRARLRLPPAGLRARGVGQRQRRAEFGANQRGFRPDCDGRGVVGAGQRGEIRLKFQALRDLPVIAHGAGKT